MNMFATNRQYIRFVTLMIPLFLVFMGMRVPDFSRPHKPKPMRRAVLDKTPANTVLQSIVKVGVDLCCIISQTPLVFFAIVEHSTVVSPVFLPVPLLLQSPFPPRAPPVTSHLT